MNISTQPKFNDYTPAQKLCAIEDIAHKMRGDVVVVPLVDGKPNFHARFDDIGCVSLVDGELENPDDADRLCILNDDFHRFSHYAGDRDIKVLSYPDDAVGGIAHVQIEGDRTGAERAFAALKRGLAGAEMVVAPYSSQDTAPVSRPANDNARPAQEPPPLIRATPFVIRDPALIPRREFLFGSHYLRKYLTATFGAGGGGKSAHTITEALSMATGRPFLSDNLSKPIRVWYVNAEDPAEEIERRFAGAVKHFRVTAEQISGRLFTDSGRDQEFVVVKENNRQTLVCHPVIEAIIGEVRAREIDVLIVDPFVSTHEVDERDNTKIQRVAAAWTRVAQEGNCAVELVHHVRKTGDEITADDGRGAGALKDKARSVRVINPMTRDQAVAAGIDPTDALSYFRIEHSKTNMTRRGGLPSWRRFASVKLGNGGKGNLASTRGDEIGVVERWDWPTSEAVAEEFDPALLEEPVTTLAASLD